jgi:Protein of unknown function (DUF669)
MSIVDEDEGFSLAGEMAAFGDELLGKAYPAGDYDMLVKKATAVKSAGGKPQVKLVLQFIGGPYDGKTVPDQLTWSAESDTAARIFAQALEKLGATQKWIQTTKPKMSQVAARILNAKVRVRLAEDDWNGTPRNKVAYLTTIALGGGAGAGNGAAATKAADAEDLDEPGEPPVSTPASADAEDLDWP